MWGRRSSALESSERLAARRKRNRLRTHILFGVLIVLLVAGFIWLTWQPSVRITRITVSDGDAQVEALARAELAGTYFHFVPRNSFFFAPEHAIRAAILAARPDIQAVSISHDQLTGLTIKPSERIAVARWCGLTQTANVPEYCYYFDASGYIFSAADTASSTQPLYPFTLYDALAPLEIRSLTGLATNTQEPLRATLAHAPQLGDAFDFARQVGSLGSEVASITIQGDEVNDLLTSGTRIIYVLGTEQTAFADLTSAKANLNLSDSSVDYVDLRFPGKVYVKNKIGG